MKKYKINDLRLPIFDKPPVVEASSPIEALKKLGYKNIKRQIESGCGDIVVIGGRGSYIYSATKEK